MKSATDTDYEPNIYDIYVGNVFMLNYYGMPIFFLISKTYSDVVCIAELETKVDRDGNAYINEYSFAKDPYIVKEYNTYRSTRYEVEPVVIDGNVYLPIKIPFASDLHKAALKKYSYVPWGTFYAIKIEQPYSRRFTLKEYDA